MKELDLSVVIINFNTKDITETCLKSVLLSTKNIQYEVILVDNGSSDGSGASLGKFNTQFNNFELVKNRENFGFAKANNQGIKKAKGRYILFLNSDTIVKDNVLGEMVTWFDENPEIGIATCGLRNEDGTIQGTGGFEPTLLRVFSWMTIEDLPGVRTLIKPFHPHQNKSFLKNDTFYEAKQELDWVTGAFLLARREVIEKIGGWDEGYFMYTEDTDLCFRAKKAGWKVVYNPKWSITHLGGKSSTREFPILSEFESIKIFYKKHYPAWQYPLLRLFLKTGAAWRMLVLGILEGRQAANTYAKALKQI